MTKVVRYEVGDAEWVELYDPSDMSHRSVVACIKQLQGFTNGHTNEDEQDQWLRERVAAWHLVDPDTGAPMDDPKTDDLGGVKKGTLKLIVEKFGELTVGSVPFGSSRTPRST